MKSMHSAVHTFYWYESGEAGKGGGGETGKNHIPKPRILSRNSGGDAHTLSIGPDYYVKPSGDVIHLCCDLDDMSRDYARTLINMLWQANKI